MLLHIPKLLNEDQLATVRGALDAQNAPWVDGRVTAGHQGAPVKRNQQIDAGSQLARELGDLIVSELERNALFVSAVLPQSGLSADIQSLHGRNAVRHACRRCGPHDSRAPERNSGPICPRPYFWRPPNPMTVASSIIESDFGSQNIKLAAGDLVVYTSTSRHRVTAVTRACGSPASFGSKA